MYRKYIYTLKDFVSFRSRGFRIRFGVQIITTFQIVLALSSPFILYASAKRLPSPCVFIELGGSPSGVVWLNGNPFNFFPFSRKLQSDKSPFLFGVQFLTENVFCSIIYATSRSIYIRASPYNVLRRGWQDHQILCDVPLGWPLYFSRCVMDIVFAVGPPHTAWWQSMQQYALFNQPINPQPYNRKKNFIQKTIWIILIVFPIFRINGWNNAI